MTTTLRTGFAEREIELACRTLVAVPPDAMRSITVLLGGPSDMMDACAVTKIADEYGLEAFVSYRPGSIRVRLARRVRLRSLL